MSASTLEATRPSTPPSEKIASTTTRTRRLPNRSPHRPASGEATAVLVRKTDTIQAIASGSAPRSRWIAGSAGTIIICVVE
jgi:hypothetical protein